MIKYNTCSMNQETTTTTSLGSFYNYISEQFLVVCQLFTIMESTAK